MSTPHSQTLPRTTDAQVKAFEQLMKADASPAWLEPMRRAGISRFAELGYPTPGLEDWRFTNLAPLAKLPFTPIRGGARLERAALEQFPFSQLPGTRLVFVDGAYAAELSTPPVRQPEVQISSLAEALAANPALVQKYLGRQGQADETAFGALNTAFFRDGGFVWVGAGRTVEAPIQLLFVSTSREAGASVQPRNLIIAGPEAKFTVLESYVSLASAATFTNAFTEFALEDHAVVEHCKFQDESPEAIHIATLHSRLGRAVTFSSHSVATGAQLSRNNIRTILDGEGIECVLNGVYLTDRDQLADHHMVVDHAKPHCASHEYFNGILAGKSKGVFHGRILVRPGAQKTDAKQTNKNLLLSDDASADTKPQLEIYADDVKCTHGATIGQLNAESVYYLRSRGIGRESARRMLIHAFAGEIIDRVKHDALREELDALLWNRLEQNEGVAVGRPASDPKGRNSPAVL
jgi:Fe-S cluster assembly protein SufD